MNSILENITRQDIYNIAVPVCICVLGGLLPLVKNNELRFARKWIQKKEKSDRDTYKYFLLVVIMAGMLFRVVGALLVYMVSLLLEQLSIKISIENMKIILSVICGACICVQSFNFRVDLEKIELRIMERCKKPILLFLYYAPFVCSVWIWCFSPHISNPIPNAIVCAMIFACEIIPFLVLNGENAYKYSCMKMYFNDGSEVAYLTECVKQQGNWIVAEDLLRSIEVRYRRDDLVKVEYFNVEVPRKDDLDAESS